MRKLEIELIKLQEWVKQKQLKVVVLFEGRDAAGKGGVIKRISGHSIRVFAELQLWGHQLTRKSRSGIFSDMSRNCLLAEKLYCSTEAGTIGPELSMSWGFVPTISMKNFSEVALNLSKCLSVQVLS